MEPRKLTLSTFAIEGIAVIGLAQMKFFGADGEAGLTAFLVGSGLPKGQGLAVEGAMGGVHDGDGDEIKVPHERGREGGVGEVVNLKGRTDLLNFSGAHDHNPIGEGEGFFLIVSDIDSGDSEGLLDAANFGAQFYPDFGIESGEGFIEQEQLGAQGNGTGQSHALLLTTGKLVG